MFKSTKFYKISCKNSHCHQHFCLFSHTAAERKLAAKATQTTATAIQTESKIVLKKRKIVETTATPTIYTNSITSTVPPSKNIETRFSTENPQIPISLHSKIPRDKRQKALTSIYAQFCRIYTNLTQNLAHKHAIDQELSIYDKCSPITYSGLVIGVLSRLKRRELALDEDDVGKLICILNYHNNDVKYDITILDQDFNQ